MHLKPDTNEEILPGYSADFPYINSCANLRQLQCTVALAQGGRDCSIWSAAL